MKFPVEPNYGPLRLPARGDELQEGRQYLLDELASAYLRDRGIVAPTIVECISRRYYARRIETITTCLETDTVRVSVHIDPARDATFRYNAGRGRLALFTLICEELHEVRSAADKRKAGLQVGIEPIRVPRHITINNKKSGEGKVIAKLILEAL